MKAAISVLIVFGVVLSITYGVATFVTSDAYDEASTRVALHLSTHECVEAMRAIDTFSHDNGERQALREVFAEDLMACVRTDPWPNPVAYASACIALARFLGNLDHSWEWNTRAREAAREGRDVLMRDGTCEATIAADDAVHELALEHTDADRTAHATIAAALYDGNHACWVRCAVDYAKAAAAADERHVCYRHRPPRDVATRQFDAALRSGKLEEARAIIWVANLGATYASQLGPATCARDIAQHMGPTARVGLWLYYADHPECVTDDQTRATLRDTIITEEPCVALSYGEIAPDIIGYLPLTGSEREELTETCFAELLAAPQVDLRAYEFSERHHMSTRARERALRAAMDARDQRGDYLIGRTGRNEIIRIYDFR